MALIDSEVMWSQLYNLQRKNYFPNYGFVKNKTLCNITQRETNENFTNHVGQQTCLSFTYVKFTSFLYLLK